MDKKAVIPDDIRSKYDKWHFSPAIESGGFLFVSGCTGTRLNGTISSDHEEQFRQAFETVQKSLVKAGLSYSDVVEMTTYHVGLKNNLEVFKQVKDEYIGEPYPAWTAVGVTELAVEGAVIEIQVTAKTR
ncbi:MAG: RidA family protein [Spirochaetes bacterium]|nr:RidA family protein [Spirochaetota bacterium]